MIFIESPSEFSYVFQFHEKRKRERKKGGEKFFERIFLTLTNFQFLERLNWIIHSQLFRNFPNRLRINIKTRVWCLIPESKQAHVPIFSKRKFTTFHTHTHTYAHSHERVHTPPKSCPVVEVSCCTLRPFHSPPSFYFAPWLRFTPSNAPSFLFLIASQSRTNDFYRVSSIVCLDTGSFDRFLRHLSTCTDVTQNIYETWTKFLLWNYLVSFSFVRRDCCYFFPSDGKWSIAWKVVGNISRGDKLKNCFGFEFFRQESSTDFLKFGFHPNENSREENNLFRRISF